MTAKKPAHPLIPADRVNGTDVYNKAGERLGKIEDVAIEKVSGEVAYAILSFGGVLGIGAKFHPVPWKLLKYDEDPQGALREEKARQDFLSGFKLGASRITAYDCLGGRRAALRRLGREYDDTCRRFGSSIDDLAPYRLPRSVRVRTG